MSAVRVRAIIKFECSKCEKFWPSFLFSNDDEFCSECSDKKPVIAAKVKFYNRVRELGGTILGKYQGSLISIKCECGEGHECNPTPSGVRYGGMCKICAGTDSATSEKNFRKRISELGGKVLGEYRGNRVSIKCECKNGHECAPMPTSIQQGQGMCKICARVDLATAGENFRKRVIELGGKVLGEYRGSRIHVKCECKNGHQCNPLPSSVGQGWGICLICVNHDSATAEANFRKRISELGGKVLGEYQGNRIPVECECIKGHVCHPYPTGVQQGQGICLICVDHDPITAEVNFRKRIAELGGRVLGEYKGNNIHIKCECKKGHECNIRPRSTHYGGGICRICTEHDPATAEENFRLRIAEFGGKVLGEYITNRIPVKCECREGHICYPYPTDIQQGGSICSSCGLKSEPLCRKIFEELLNYSMSKSRPRWLMWKHGKSLELDGYNEENKIAFEYQGIQHTEYCPHFHPNGIEDLENQQERDIFKAQACSKQGVTLICVPCDYTYRDPEAMKMYIISELIKCKMIEK